MAEEEGEPSAKRRRLGQKSTTELCKETTNSSSRDNPDEPPLLSTNLPSRSDIQAVKKCSTLPVDILLVTVKDCEFLACYQQLKDPYKYYFDDLGYVYFGEVDNESEQDNVRVALLECFGPDISPGGPQIKVMKAVPELRPKAVISVGTCSSLNPDKFKLGDVVVSAKLTTYASKVVTSDQEQSTGIKTPVTKRFLGIIKNCADGWQAPLKNPEARDVKVHRDAEILSGPELVSAENRRKKFAEDHPHATAIEMEGEGIFTAAFDCQIEWLIVKGIADYADGDQLTEKSWSPCASVMAASLVAHILSDSAVFRSWPHYKVLTDSATAFLKSSREQLCTFYNGSMSQVMISPWDVTETVDIDDVYVQLSFLKDDRKPTGTTKEKLQDYSEIFEGREHHLVPKRILVYGRPGIGKTTFTKKLAVDWSRGKKEILEKFSVVLLIKLRDICSTQDLRAMLETAELLSADDPMAFNQLYDYVLENQQKVLLVFDGFDEYSAAKSSEVHQIWKGSKLRYCTVLVTSRPLKEAELRQPSHAQFEINGFDREQVEQFVCKFLQKNDEEAIDEFLDFLDRKDLWEMAEIPLLLLILFLTWKEKGHQVILSSRADLFLSFFQTLFDHATAKTPGEEFKSIDECNEYKEDLSKFGKLAFEALLTDCYHFMRSKLPEDIIQKYIAVGFFQVSKLSSFQARPGEIVCFLHKMFQEFLCAWFIVQELTNARNETPTCLSKLDSFEKIKEFDKTGYVFWFVFELSSEAASAVFRHLEMMGKKERLTEYNFTESPSIEDLSDNEKEFCSFTLQLFHMCPNSKAQIVYPSFIQCVNSVLVLDFSWAYSSDFAYQRLWRLSTLPRPNYLFFNTTKEEKQKVDDIAFSMMHDLETVIVTCYGDTKSVNNNNTDHLYIDEVFLKKEGQQMVLYLTKIRNHCYELLSALISEPESSPRKPVDHVWQNQDARSSLDLTEKTSDQTQKHSLSFVRKITIEKPTSEELIIVNNVLSFVRRPQVVHIEGDCEREEPHDAQLVEKLVSHISFTNSLVELELLNINLTANCAAVIARFLRQTPNLHTLTCTSSHNPMYNGVYDLVENLHHTAHLHRLELSKVHMGDRECQLLATSLRHVERLQQLVLSCNPLGQGIIELARHLYTVPHLTELDLIDTQMGKEEVIAVACSLHHVDLKELWLSNNPLGEGIIELARHLHTVPHLTKLYLEDTQMGKEEVIAVACSLHHVDLKVLWLRNNPLGEGIIELARHLHNVPHLTQLILNSTQMGEKEVIAVARALKNVPELKALCLANNPLGRGISELIQHLRSIPRLRCLGLLDVQMTKKEAIDLCTAVHEGMIKLYTDYNEKNPQADGNYRLYTEAELEQRGVEFDDEFDDE